MADKPTTTLLESLSNALFGRKHEWKKLTTRGVDVFLQDGTKVSKRKVPLTETQAKDYMVAKLADRAKKEQDEKADTKSK